MEIKNVYTVYVMEPQEDDAQSAVPRIMQRFWVDDKQTLADLGDIMEYLECGKPPFKWLAENCVEKNGRLYIIGRKALELILELAAQGLIKADVPKIVWYGQYLTNQMVNSAENAYLAWEAAHNLPFEPDEDEVITECEDGDGG